MAGKRRRRQRTVEAALKRGCIVTRSTSLGTVRWLIVNPEDEIQSVQLQHGFYEIEDLRKACGLFGSRRNILDVGANIGNHTVYFLLHFKPEKLVSVEPFDAAARHLMINVGLNLPAGADYSVVRKGLGSKEALVDLTPPSDFNIGLTKLNPDAAGLTPVVLGDQVVGSWPVDLIKIDVEGMECDVIAGLRQTLARHRPALYVEVSGANISAFQEEMREQDYEVTLLSQPYPRVFNYACLPCG
jgi:FkbM family methyltransferase